METHLTKDKMRKLTSFEIIQGICTHRSFLTKTEGACRHHAFTEGLPECNVENCPIWKDLLIPEPDLSDFLDHMITGIEKFNQSTKGGLGEN